MLFRGEMSEGICLARTVTESNDYITLLEKKPLKINAQDKQPIGCAHAVRRNGKRKLATLSLRIIKLC
jgi:hypothetical protein